MKFSRTLPIFIIAGILFCTANLFSQETKKKTSKFPKERIGLGIHVTGSQSFGGVIAYAINTNVHIGTQIGFKYDGGSDLEDAETYFLFAPYARYFFDNILSFRPFIQGSFYVVTRPEMKKGEGSSATTFKKIAVSTESLVISVGGQWFPYKSVGILGGFRVLSYTISPSRFQGGLMEPFVGIEWFL